MEFKTHVTLHKDGTYSLGVNLDYGFMSPDDMIKLAELAKKHNVGEMMCTTAKKIIANKFKSVIQLKSPIM